MSKPALSEYPVHYHRYVALVPGENLLELWDENTEGVQPFFLSIEFLKHEYRYAKDKWTVKDVLMHLADSDRGYANRSVFCVRGDHTTPLYPMDENLFAANVDTSSRTMASLVKEFVAIRNCFKMIFEHTSSTQQQLLGNGTNGKISARALGFIALGHAIHHMNIVQERYLNDSLDRITPEY